MRHLGVRMKVLITGHEGFIGRHFHTKLKAEGHEVLGIDIKRGPSYDCRYFFGSSDEQFDLVIHCAAMVGGRAKIDGDPLAVAQNLAIDSDMMRWAVRTKPRHLVYFSSSAAYPVQLQGSEARIHHILLSEDDLHTRRKIGKPDQTYGWAKLTGELLAEYVAAECPETSVHVFRPFSGYGTDQDLDYPFPSFIHRARCAEDVFDIWGTGSACRDFIHVDDVVAAVRSAVDQDVRGTWNLCTGRPTSFTRLAELVMEAAGNRLKIRYLRDKPVGVMYRVGDPRKMERELWEPKVSLEEGIRRALAGDL
jgi:nucleoside-diphosphate-sugar epimerase